MRSSLKFAIAMVVLSATSCSESSSTAAMPEQPIEEPAMALPKWAPVRYESAAGAMRLNDTNMFFTAFQKAIDRSAKGEFESTDQYKERMADPDTVLAPITTKDVYLFAPEDSTLKYNADSESYEPSYTFSHACYSEYPIDEGFACKFSTVVDESREYVGTNSFGASADVVEKRGRDLYFVFDPKRHRKLLQTPGRPRDFALPVRCNVPVEKAKNAGEVGVAFAVRVTRAEMFHGNSRLERATVASPRDEYFTTLGIPVELVSSICYSKTTGEILSATDL